MPPLSEHIVLRNRDIENIADFDTYLKHGGYEALRPTKGWLRVSAKRLRAQGRLRALIERLTLRRA